MNRTASQSFFDCDAVSYTYFLKFKRIQDDFDKFCDGEKNREL